MTFGKKLMVAAAAGALTAATAVPAMALENEFHGMFRVRGIISNWDAEGTITNTIAGDTREVRKYVEQRARLLYMAKVSDDLKLITHFEIDSRWGDDSYNVNRNDGGALGADQVNLETKNVYLDFNIPGVPVNGKVGIQPLTDSIKGILVNADAAGALFTTKAGKATVGVGYFRFDDKYNNNAAAGTTPAGSTDAAFAGTDVRDFYLVDAKYAINDKVKVGAAWYGTFANAPSGNGAIAAGLVDLRDTRYSTFALNAEGKFGPAVVDGFVAYQVGNVLDNHLSAWAANVGAKVQAGPGAARAQFLYTSGDDGEGTNTNWQSTVHRRGASENSFYPSAMRILMRDATATAGTDRAVVSTSSNRGRGIIGGFVGYDANITDKVFGNVNGGFMSTATEGSKSYVGTEFNAEIGYKISQNLTTSLTGAYVLPGAYMEEMFPQFKHDDPWTARMMLNFTF